MRKKSISIFQYLIKYVNFVKKTFENPLQFSRG